MLATQLHTAAEKTAALRDDIFARWETVADLEAIVAVETHPLTNEQLRRFAEAHPPPASWYEETIDPFVAEE